MHVPVGRNRYCGPAAYAIICGGDTDQAAAAIRCVSGKRAVFGTHPWVLTRALANAGRLLAPVELPRRMSLREFVHWLGESPTLYLVEVTDHWVVVRPSTREACDNKSVYPLPIDRFGRAGKIVRRAWWVQ